MISENYIKIRAKTDTVKKIAYMILYVCFNNDICPKFIKSFLTFEFLL